MRIALLLALTTCCPAVPLLAGEATDLTQPVENVLQFRASVAVGEDGNGVTSARFPTTVGGPDVQYLLVIENGCTQEAGGQCPAAVRGLTVTLNDDVVFQNDDEFGSERVQIALNEVGGQLNSILLAAKGAPQSGARVALLATRPLPVVMSGRSVLPLATTADHTQDLLVIHNAGPAAIAFRLEIYNVDGTPIGLSPARVLAPYATETVDLGLAGTALNPAWVRGPVHVRWAARGLARVSTVVREYRRAPDGSGRLVVVGTGELALDDYGTAPIGHAEAALFGL